MTKWSPLRTALAACRRDGLRVPLWWRDDDAVEATPALDRLAALSESLGLDVHLAVVPRDARGSLAKAVTSAPGLVPVVHGWHHANHAPAHAKKAEFGAPRGNGAEEIAASLTRLRGMFGDRLLPFFVPPWNRIDQSFFPTLAAAGYRGLSTFGPRSARLAAPRLTQINTHIDPIDWHGSRDLRNPEHIIATLAHLLEQRRTGDADVTEPLGYLTHHLVHSRQLWDFSHAVLTELLEGGATPQPLAPLLETPDEPT